MTIDTKTDMTPPTSEPSGFVGRAKRIMMEPKLEWDRIADEPATVQNIYTGYVMILAAIPAAATLIGGLAFGYSFLGVTYRPPVTEVLGSAVASYLGSLVGVFLIALVIDWLAPRFGGVSDRVQAVKVSAYSMTASWLAGIFLIMPSLAFLNLLGLYSLYLLYVGLPRLMRAPEDKAMSYTIVTIVAAFVVVLALAAVLSALLPG